MSTDSQVELSPDSQMDKILEFAQKNGIIVKDEFVFIEGEKKKGLSGRRADNRPQFQKMIAYAKQSPRPFDTILVWKFSRFARNIDEATYYKSILRGKCGVDVVSVSEPIVEGMYGRLIEMIIEWSDEFYSINLAAEVIRGMSSRARKGEFCSYAPFGYKMVNKKLVVDEEKAPVVKRVFLEYAAGEKIRKIAENLNLCGIRTRFGNPINTRFILYMISNPVYKGNIVFSTHGKRNRFVTEKDDNIIQCKGKHEPLVNSDLWQRCYTRFTKERRSSSRETSEIKYSLHSLLICADCGSVLTYCGNGRLQCSAYNRGVCKVSHSISISDAENAVLESIKSDTLNVTARLYNGCTEPEKHDMIEYGKKKLLRLEEAYLNGFYTSDEYLRKKEELLKGVSVIQSADSFKSNRISDDLYIDTADIYETMTTDEKNFIMKNIIDKIIVNKSAEGYIFEVNYKF